MIGLGAIGRGVLDLLAGDDAVEVVGALVADPSKPRPPGAPKICASVAELTEQKPRVVVEAGGHAALRSCGPPARGCYGAATDPRGGGVALAL